MPLDLVEQQRVHGAVALLGHAAQDTGVLLVVEVVVTVADVEERVASEPEGLMDLEVEDDVGHDRSSR